MNPLKYLPLVLKQITRRQARTLLTVSGVAVAMFLFAAVQAMQAGVKKATQTAADETTLIVYRQNRYCPFASRLPEYYGERIAAVPGVAAAAKREARGRNKADAKGDGKGKKPVVGRCGGVGC